MTANTKEFLETKLSSKLWRMSNLYTILDKDGVKRILKLNKSQKTVLTKYKHSKKIILKSRQQGISTLFLAYYLDDCLFKPGYQAGIQSYGQDEAEKLSKRALLMWNELDDTIKELLNIKLVSNNSKGMTFSNGSILKIGNFRGDTLQGLHVSELGKIAKKYPEKAKELKTGAFQAVGKNNKITIESTSEGASGMFFEMCQKAMNIQKQIESGEQSELSPFDFQFIFLSWVDDPDCNINVPQPINKVHEEYFAKIEKDLDIVLTSTQKWWYINKAEELGEYMSQEYPTTPEEAFLQSVEGTYYAREFERLEVRDGLYNPNAPVFCSMDIGVNDENTILFAQYNGEYIDIISEYGNSGVGLEYYRDIYKELSKAHGYQYDFTLFPHDIRNFEYGNSKTRLQVARQLGFQPRVVKKHGLLDGIEITRQFLAGKLVIDGKPKKIRIDSQCVMLLKAIQLYRKKYDKRLDVFMDKPEHDEMSHWADALRYLACGLLVNIPKKHIRDLGTTLNIDLLGGFAI